MKNLCPLSFSRNGYYLFAQWLTIALLAILLSPYSGLAAPTDQQMAWDLVQGWLGEQSSRMTEGFQGELSDIKTYTDEYGEPLYFVAEISPQGYVIVSADDLIEPIIAFSSAGHYVEDSNNPLTTLVKQDMKERKGQARGKYFIKEKHQKKTEKEAAIAEKLASKQTKSNQKWGKYKNKSKQVDPKIYQNSSSVADQTFSVDNQLYDAASISDVRVAPLLPTKWNQLTSRDSNYSSQNLYNIYTPNNYYSGCVATAMAQIMRYHSHPTGAIGQVTKSIQINGGNTTRTTRGGNGAGGAYNWGIMTTDPTTVPYNASSWNMIGALMHDAGVSVNMNYTGSGSGTQISPVGPALTGVFQYANAQRTIFYGVDPPGAQYELILNSNMHAGSPVLLGIIGSPGGHAVVADGYGYDSSTTYHHINMGWGGNSGAWYNLPTIGSFNTVPEFIYNIFPTKSGEIISGRVVNNVGTPLSGVTVSAVNQGGGPTYADSTDSNGYYGVVVPGNATYDLTAITSQLTDISVGTSTLSSTGNVIDANITIVTGVTPDNKADLLWRNTSTGQVYTWLLDGTTGFGSLTHGSIIDSMPAEWLLKGIGDFDGDGTDDLVWYYQPTGQTYIWCLNSVYPFSQLSHGSIINSMPAEWQIVGVGNFDGDLKDDLLWRNTTTGEVYVWLMDGTNDFSQLSHGSIISSMPSSWQIDKIGDFNGDNKDDLLWRSSVGEIYIWLMDAINDFSQLTHGSIIASMPSNWQISQLGDLNGDSKADTIWRNTSTGEIYVWLMDGIKDFSQLAHGSIISSMPSDWKIVATGDVNADGMDDTIWRNTSTGEVYVWLMDGIKDFSQLSHGSIISSMPSDWQIVGAGNFNGN